MPEAPYQLSNVNRRRPDLATHHEADTLEEAVRLAADLATMTDTAFVRIYGNDLPDGAFDLRWVDLEHDARRGYTTDPQECARILDLIPTPADG